MLFSHDHPRLTVTFLLELILWLVRRLRLLEALDADVVAPRMKWCCWLNVKLLVLCWPKEQGGRAEAEALSDISLLLAESAERTGELISDTPGYYKHDESSKHCIIMIQGKTLFTPQIPVSDVERLKLFLWNIASIKCEYFQKMVFEVVLQQFLLKITFWKSYTKIISKS